MILFIAILLWYHCRGFDVHRQMFVQIPCQKAVEMPRRSLPFGDVVRSIWVRHDRKCLVGGDQLIYQIFGLLVMDIVVASTMNIE